MVVHCAAGVLLSTQAWKHPMAVAQVLSLRHISVSVQQLLTMHWLQGVPPGSSEQLPASMGLPQWPPVHTSGLQHWLLLRQEEPWLRQLPSPHSLLVHCRLQHSLAMVQLKPSNVHCPPGAQLLLSQLPLQHSLLPMQNAPLG